jgi:outer membrane protein assembly factor BamB
MTIRSAATLALLAPLAAAQAPSWPQWGGPNRDFMPPARGLAASWPAAGPRVLWSRPLGDGYSGIVSDASALYTLHRPGNGSRESVIALDAATGRTLWEHVYEAPHQPGMDMEYGPGPHSTPLLVGERLFAVGVTGKLHALDRRTGKVIWSHDLVGGLKGKMPGRGYACSPIAHGSNVIVTVGGAGQALVAFDQATGRVAWKNASFDPAPSSPTLIRVDGQEQLLVFHADGVGGFDPASGAPFWDHPHKTDYGLNISTPVWGPDNVLFISSAYSGGSRALRLSQAGGKTAVKELWFSNRMRIHIGNAVRSGGHVYGSSGDFGPAFLAAVDVATGQVAWQERGLARGNLLLADGKLLILDEDGTLALATATPSALTIHSKSEVLSGRCWTAPTLVGTRLYLRDRAQVKALDLGSGGHGGTGGPGGTRSRSVSAPQSPLNKIKL